MVGSCVNLFRAGWLTTIMQVISSLGDGVFPVLLTIFVAALFYRKDKIFGITFAFSALVGEITKSLLKGYFQIPRPDSYGCIALTAFSDKYSFPSGHTIFYTIFFGLIGYYCYKNWSNIWARIVFALSIMMIALVGYSRIYLGAHWPVDVLGGYIVGGTILSISILLYQHFTELKHV